MKKFFSMLMVVAILSVGVFGCTEEKKGTTTKEVTKDKLKDKEAVKEVIKKDKDA